MITCQRVQITRITVSRCGACGQDRRQATLTATKLEADTSRLIQTLVGTGSGRHAVDHSVVVTWQHHLYLQAEVDQIISWKVNQPRKKVFQVKSQIVYFDNTKNLFAT